METDELLESGFRIAAAAAHRRWRRAVGRQPDFEDARQRAFERLCGIAHRRHECTKDEWAAMAAGCGKYGAIDEARDLDGLSGYSRRIVNEFRRLAETTGPLTDEQRAVRDAMAVRHADKLTVGSPGCDNLSGAGPSWEECSWMSDGSSEDAMIAGLDARRAYQRALDIIATLPLLQRTDYLSYLRTGRLARSAAERGVTEAAVCINIGLARKAIRAAMPDVELPIA